MRFEDLSADEQAMERQDEAVWARAHRIAARHPELDVSDIHHTLLQLDRSPAQRLATGLRRGKLAPR